MSTQATFPLMGQMMNQPLLISSIIRHADRHFGKNEIVSRRIEGDIHRYTYHDCHRRSRQLANALKQLGIGNGERVATLAWNGYRHLEAYFAISGSGAVLHTINPRLFPDQIAYIANHAEDQYLFFDLNFLPLVESFADQCTSIKGFVMMCDKDRMPVTSRLANLMCYEDLISQSSDEYDWPELDENCASSLCYTSGTTGNPKGALYSHRSTVLHSFGLVFPDAFNISGRDSILPVVPMFHVNAWGVPYAAPMTGAKLVFPGMAMDGKSIYQLFEQEKVTISAGVPTVWQGLISYVQANGLKFPHLKRIVVGGAACPPSMMVTFRQTYGIETVHAWGMTEMSPLGTVCTLQTRHLELSEQQQHVVLHKQGHAIYGVDMKIVDDLDNELPWDGKTFGNLMVRGLWVINNYFKNDENQVLQNGWFPTGDVATIDGDGYMQITDRSKDVIKSGGEWIGTIDLENIAMSHPAVLQAACLGIFHPKWDERPLLVVVLKPGIEVEKTELLQFYEGKIAKWWTPDDVQFVAEMPLGATGKILKTRLREQFREFQFSTP